MGILAMSKSKQHKYELATHKTTEDRASNAILNEQINEWVNRAIEAGRIVDGDGVNSSINRVADVLTDLILQTKKGKVSREVISGVVSRVNLRASLIIAQNNLTRSNRNVTGKRS